MRNFTSRRWLLMLLALAIVIGSGFAHGLCSDRWSASERLQTAAGQLGLWPMVLDEWQGSTDPTKAESHPDYTTKLHLVSATEEPFRYVFASRTRL